MFRDFGDAGSGFAGVPGIVGAPRTSLLGAVRGLASGLDSAFLDDRSIGQVVRDNVAAVRQAGVIRTAIGAGAAGSALIPATAATRFAGTTNIGVEVGAAARASQIASVQIGQALGATRSAEFIGPTIGRSRFAGPGDFAEVVGARVQGFTDGAFPVVLGLEARGALRGNPSTRIGTRLDRIVNQDIRDFLNVEGITEGPGQLIQLDRRLVDPAGSGTFVRPDVRIPLANRTFEVTVADKRFNGSQLQGFLNFSNDNVTIIRPAGLPDRGSFSLVR